MRTIRRYANRKLYDPVDSHYVTLGELARLIRSGEEVQVVDRASGKDLTSQTMAQIIFEEEHESAKLGIDQLVSIIRQGLAA